MNPPAIRILIADDHAVVRRGLAMVLRLEVDFEVVGEADSGPQAVDLCARLNPDILLLDRVMPGSDPRRTIQQVKQEAPGTHIVMLTGTELDAQVLELLTAGADGYVLKEIEPQELKAAIRIVAGGESYLQPAVTRHVINTMAAKSQAQNLLTPRESELLVCMASEATYREIADQLSISEETVRSHTKSILNKLAQPNRAAAVAEAVRLGLIPPTKANDR